MEHTLTDNSLFQHICNALNEEELFLPARDLHEQKNRFSRLNGEMVRLYQ
jgi:hypothetical protein